MLLSILFQCLTALSEKKYSVVRACGPCVCGRRRAVLLYCVYWTHHDQLKWGHHCGQCSASSGSCPMHHQERDTNELNFLRPVKKLKNKPTRRFENTWPVELNGGGMYVVPGWAENFYMQLFNLAVTGLKRSRCWNLELGAFRLGKNTLKSLSLWLFVSFFLTKKNLSKHLLHSSSKFPQCLFTKIAVY